MRARGAIGLTIWLSCGSLSAAPLKMPEPLVDESITDIDDTEAGELEIDLAAGALGHAPGGTTLWMTGAEAELRVNPKIGLALDVTFGGRAPTTPDQFVTSVLLAGSWALYQNFARELHLQLQFYGRLYTNESLKRLPGFELGDPEMPLAVRLNGAWRRNALNIRWGLGGGAGGEIDTAPLLANLCVLWEWGRPVLATFRRAFVALELDFDGGRELPLLIAPEIAVHLPLGRMPVRLGAVVPLLVGGDRVSAGGVLRLVIETFDE